MNGKGIINQPDQYIDAYLIGRAGPTVLRDGVQLVLDTELVLPLTVLHRESLGKLDGGDDGITSKAGSDASQSAPEDQVGLALSSRASKSGVHVDELVGRSKTSLGVDSVAAATSHALVQSLKAILTNLSSHLV